MERNRTGQRGRDPRAGVWRRRCRGLLLPVAAVLGAGLGAPAAGAQPRQQRQALVPANFRQVTDAQGFMWDVTQNGSINNGTGDSFDSAMVLSVNGNSFQQQQSPMMTPDGSEYVFTGNVSNLLVMRRVKVDLKACAVRYIDVVRNPTPSPVTASLTFSTRFGSSQAQILVTDTGNPAAGVLGKKDTGIVAFVPPNNMQMSVVFHLAGARSKVKPVMRCDQNMRFTFTYSLAVPPGKSVGILHGIAQRRLVTPPDAKAAAAFLKPFGDRKWTADLPRDVRRTLVNLGGISFGGLGGASRATLESLGVEPGSSDVLAVGETTRLQGTATCTGLAIETRYGPVKIAFDDVAAVVGRRHGSRRPRIFLRDGQVYSGKLQVEGLKFTMNTGLPVALSAENLDRLVMHLRSDEKDPPAEVFAMLETIDGDRLALVRSEAEQVTVTTPWGDRKTALEEIRRWVAAEGHFGHRLVLRDGSRLFAFLDERPLAVKTLVFGARELPAVDVRAIVAVDGKAGDEWDPADIAAPHLVLAGENLMVGRVDLPAIHLITAGQAIPVPPNQIRLMRNVSDGDETPGEGGRLFEAELWDGGTLAGKLREVVLPVRSGDRVVEVLARDVVEIRVPSPTVAEGIRTKIAKLIRDLGHPDYATREAARKTLAELGHLPRLQLEEALKQTSDPEVRRSVQALLEELK